MNMEKENSAIIEKLCLLEEAIERARIRFKKRIIENTVISILTGILLGCWIMFICNKEAIRHYNSCQESELLKKLSESRDEKQWYIKEDAFGKIKIVQFSNNQIDSLTEITAHEQ